MKDIIFIAVGTACVLFFCACLVMVVFFWDKAQANMREAGYKYSRITGVVGCLFFIAIGGYMALDGYSGYHAKAPSSINSVEQAQKYVLGTWVYADPLDPNNLYVNWWQKWVVKEGGVMDVYTADPRDDSWGKPETVRYEVFTQKYSDTGERFYAIRVLGTAQTAIILPGGALSYSIMGNGAVPMRRGDRNPFSK